MRNKITGADSKDRRSQIVKGLLFRMDADIMDPNGNFPAVHVEQIGSLQPGGSILLSVPDSRHCYLVTDDPNVEYQPGKHFPSCIAYTEIIKNPARHQRKDRNYRFITELAGQMKRGG